MKYVLVIAVLLSFAVPAKADVFVMQHDCGKWLKARKNDDPNTWQLEQFLAGFLSGMAIGSDEEFWVLGNSITPDQVFYWMDNYCKDNPLETITRGGITLFNERTGY